MVTLKTIGALRCLVRDGGPGTVVLLHGFGANAADLAPLADALDTSARLVFPEGPVALGGASRAWWMIDEDAIRRAQLTGVDRDLGGPMNADASQAIETVVDFCRELDAESLVVGGFSQGAMLASHVGLRLDAAGMLLFSGNALDVASLEKARQGRRRPRVFQSHGTFDPILPLRGATRLFDTLDSGDQGEFLEFPGEHEIPAAAITKARALIADVL